MRAHNDTESGETIGQVYILCSKTDVGDGRVVRRCWVNFQCRGVLLTWITVGQGPIVLAVGAGGVVWIFFSQLSLLFFLPVSGRRPDMD